MQLNDKNPLGLRTLVIRFEGVVCSGYNGSYKLGEGGTTNKKCSLPVLGIGGAGTLTNVSHMHVGGDYYEGPAVVLSSGDGVQWGYNNFGQLGDNSVTTRQYPQYVQLP